MNHPDELVRFVNCDLLTAPESLSIGLSSRNDPPWKILIVDDDEDVHQATCFGLSDTEILGRSLEFLHAYSAQEACKQLEAAGDVAVILLDVVMESDDAGFNLVRTIRDDLHNLTSRIILRTGQPGYAPEMSAIREYDINDYKTKSELSHPRLFTSLTAAIRAYDQICRLESSRNGLELIVKASGELMRETGLHDFASGVVTQLAALIGVPNDGLVCVKQEKIGDDQHNEFVVIGAAGKFEPCLQKVLGDIGNPIAIDSLRTSLLNRESIFAEDHIVLFVQTSDGTPFATFIDTPVSISQIDQSLIEVFCNNVSLCAQNIKLVERLKDFAFFDRLVRLPNRTAFVEAIDEYLKNGGEKNHAVAIINIDQFAEINNAFGHVHGDALLCATAQHLLDSFGQDCVVARLSGDTFGLLGSQEIVTPSHVRPAFVQALTINGLKQALNVSIGYVALSDSPINGASVLKDAAIARKIAKQQGVNRDIVYSPNMGIEARESTKLLHELKLAFENEQLFPMFQPQIDLQSKKLIGFEALMRWRDSDGNLIPPDRFIPLAENSGMIVELGYWILGASLDTLRQIHDLGYPSLRVAVNVSVVQFRDSNFVSSVADALSASGLPAAALELEITESVATMGAQMVQESLNRLRALGVAVAIDDFGTGYSSLSYLEKLPIDRLKIDRSFVCSLDCNSEGGRIVGLIIQIARQLGLRTIAEGIETEVHVERLRELGCEEGQGFLLGRPMSAADLPAWLQKHAPQEAFA